MFAQYAAIVKNLRGVILLQEVNQDVASILKWLAERFKYRDIGIPYSMSTELPEDLKKYFIELHYPMRKLDFIEKVIRNIYGFNLNLSRALVISSIYIAPLMNIDYAYDEEFEKISIADIYVGSALDNKSWKLHFRIADYTILDFYRLAVEEAMDIIRILKSSENNIDHTYIDRVLDERANRISKDIKRYWRIKSSKGIRFLTYIDNLKLLIHGYKSGKVDVKDLNLDFAAALSIIPVVWLNRDTIREL